MYWDSKVCSPGHVSGSHPISLLPVWSVSLVHVSEKTLLVDRSHQTIDQFQK